MLSRSNTISEGTEFKLVVVDGDDDKTCRPRLQKATVPKSVDKNARERSSIEQFMVWFCPRRMKTPIENIGSMMSR